MEPSSAKYEIDQDDRAWIFSTELVGPDEDLKASIYEKDNEDFRAGYSKVFTLRDLYDCNPRGRPESTLDVQYIIDECILKHKVMVNDLENVVDVIFDLTDFDEERIRNKGVLRLDWKGGYPLPCRRKGEDHNPERVEKLEEDTHKIEQEQRQMREQLNRLLYGNFEDEKRYPLDEEQIGQNKMKNANNNGINDLDLSGLPPSTILLSQEELAMLGSKINKYNAPAPKVRLLYKASKDGDQAASFHYRCDNKGKTLILISTQDSYRFGGFTTQNWAGNKVEKEDDSAFVFSLDKLKTYDLVPGCVAIGCYPKFGPVFMGCQIKIYDNAFQRPGTTFEAGVNYNTTQDYELNGGKREFIVREIEVYEIMD